LIYTELPITPLATALLIGNSDLGGE
jgi:hypothetical protein